MLLPSLLKSGDQVYQKVIKQLYQKMLLLNLLITLSRIITKGISDLIPHYLILILYKRSDSKKSPVSDQVLSWNISTESIYVNI